MHGATLPSGAKAYLGVMPAEILSRIYDEFGQRLLEGNVRTFLDFRGGVNRGLRHTLLTEPKLFCLQQWHNFDCGFRSRC